MNEEKTESGTDLYFDWFSCQGDATITAVDIFLQFLLFSMDESFDMCKCSFDSISKNFVFRNERTTSKSEGEGSNRLIYFARSRLSRTLSTEVAMSFNSRSISDELETSNDRFKSRPRYCKAERVESISVTKASAFWIHEKRQRKFLFSSFGRKDVRQVSVQSRVEDDWYSIGDGPYLRGNDYSSDKCLPLPFDVVGHEYLHEDEGEEGEPHRRDENFSAEIFDRLAKVYQLIVAQLSCVHLQMCSNRFDDSVRFHQSIALFTTDFHQSLKSNLHFVFFFLSLSSLLLSRSARVRVRPNGFDRIHQRTKPIWNQHR